MTDLNAAFGPRTGKGVEKSPPSPDETDDQKPERRSIEESKVPDDSRVNQMGHADGSSSTDGDTETPAVVGFDDQQGSRGVEDQRGYDPE